MATTTKPSYLGLLNAISLAESGAGVSLQAWANATPNDELADALRFVAARETSHGDVFCRRIKELGFDLLQKPDPGAAERLAKVANPKVSDLEKIGPDRDEGQDFFGGIEKQLDEGIFDPLTAKLMVWYIGEERDSGKVLNEAYDCVRSMSNGKSPSAAKAMAPTTPSADADAMMACMTAGFTRLEKALEKLAKAK